ncbi:eukaryotic translation initiation factor 3 subunit J-A isoform X2 [Clupea harengus]|uniref:Eukaryotic translation initiation factor 3 subunit J n=1 Tax=Clupea harengus TaxID=7950 RepID=A0A6P8EWB9_CLUHA|nr:eukaryotic translation initiation factor 3 subunit J-A isoform X2 [Clupea harengus]
MRLSVVTASFYWQHLKVAVNTSNMADGDSWDADSFDPDEPIKKVSVHDKWEGEDEEEDVKDNWDDEEEEEEKSAEKLTEAPSTEKKKLNDKIKEKENLQRKKQEELQKRIEEESDESSEVKSEDKSEDKPEDEIAEKIHLKKLQEDSDLELANDTFGVVSNHVTGIDAINPSSKDDFTEFEKLLKDKIMPYEKSIHYSSFLESLFRNVCLSLEVEDLKKINTSLTVLLSEKQKQEKNKGKKKKKGIVPAGGLKAKMKDDLDDYGEFDGGYTQDYEDFM